MLGEYTGLQPSYARSIRASTTRRSLRFYFRSALT